MVGPVDSQLIVNFTSSLLFKRVKPIVQILRRLTVSLPASRSFSLSNCLFFFFLLSCVFLGLGTFLPRPVVHKKTPPTNQSINHQHHRIANDGRIDGSLGWVVPCRAVSTGTIKRTCLTSNSRVRKHTDATVVSHFDCSKRDTLVKIPIMQEWKE